jgi:hypothetical protein
MIVDPTQPLVHAEEGEDETYEEAEEQRAGKKPRLGAHCRTCLTARALHFHRGDASLRFCSPACAAKLFTVHR